MTTHRSVTTHLLINLHIYFVEDGLGAFKVFSVNGAKTFWTRGKVTFISETVPKILCIYILILAAALPVQNYAEVWTPNLILPWAQKHLQPARQVWLLWPACHPLIAEVYCKQPDPLEWSWNWRWHDIRCNCQTLREKGLQQTIYYISNRDKKCLNF